VRLSINYALSRLAVIDEEVVRKNFDGFALLQVDLHEARFKVGRENLVVQVAEHLLLVATALVEILLGCPDRGNTHHSYIFGHALVNFNIRSLLDLPEERPRIPNVELVVLIDFQNLIAVHTLSDVLLEKRLQDMGQQLFTTSGLPFERDQRHSLKLLWSPHCLSQSYRGIGSDFAKIKRGRGGYVELHFANAEIRLLLEDSGA